MKRMLASVALVALLVVAGTAATASATPAAATAAAAKQKPKPKKPTATIAFLMDVSVKGKNFKKHEKLTITLSSATTSEKWTKKATATLKGTFSVSFGALALNSCDQYTLRIVGSMKSRFTTSHAFVPC